MGNSLNSFGPETMSPPKKSTPQSYSASTCQRNDKRSPLVPPNSEGAGEPAPSEPFLFVAHSRVPSLTALLLIQHLPIIKEHPCRCSRTQTIIPECSSCSSQLWPGCQPGPLLPLGLFDPLAFHKSLIPLVPQGDLLPPSSPAFRVPAPKLRVVSVLQDQHTELTG